eukprot:gene774-959_t
MNTTISDIYNNSTTSSSSSNANNQENNNNVTLSSTSSPTQIAVDNIQKIIDKVDFKFDNLRQQQQQQQQITTQSPTTTSSSSSIEQKALKIQVTPRNLWVWSPEWSVEEKVNRLSSLCQSKFDNVYQCELENGNNSSKCVDIINSLESCISKQLCPSENKFKKEICSSISTMMPNGGDLLCQQFTQRLDHCVDNSLSNIWGH